MSDLLKNARFIGERVQESEVQREARARAIEERLHAVSPALGAHLSFVMAAACPRSIIEVGTGVGVATLWLHRGAPQANITALEAEPERLAHARASLVAAGARPAQLRFIAGDPMRLLERMTEAAYDAIVVDESLEHVAGYLQHALRLARPGGTILVLSALNGGRVADPTRRDPVTANLRSLLRELERQPDLAVSLLPIDGGVLQIAKRR
ncbi:MAG: methyltransferase domain-containing protein [Pseudoclavibacter sp.]|nr:methyltransferase domain-containing protein [Pseudoclavibacter sp.]